MTDEVSVRPDTGESTETELGLLRRQLVSAAVDLPGVLRIEHTLSGAVRAISLDDDPRSVIRVTSRHRLVDVEISIAAHAGHQTRRLAHELRDRLQQVITDQGLTPGTLEVNVLSIER